MYKKLSAVGCSHALSSCQCEAQSLVVQGGQWKVPSRRQVLKTAALALGSSAGAVAGVGALAALGSGESWAQTPPMPKGPLVDTHHHFYPPEYYKAWMDYEDPSRTWTKRG